MVREEREFHISLKTPHIWLAAQKHWGAFGVRERIADDIIADAMELERGIDWGVVLNYITCVAETNKGKSRFFGKLAIANSIAATVGSVAVNMGWDMHSPQIVYMSGYHPLWALGKNLSLLNERLHETEEGKRKFISDEAKEAMLAKERQEAGRIDIFRNRLGQSLEVYTQQALSENPLYLRILQWLMYSRSSSQKYKAYKLLRAGNLEEVSTTVNLGGLRL